MPQIVDPLPQDLGDNLARLSVALDEAVPPRQLDRNLLVATWNVRAFGGVTEKCRPSENARHGNGERFWDPAMNEVAKTAGLSEAGAFGVPEPAAYAVCLQRLSEAAGQGLEP